MNNEKLRILNSVTVAIQRNINFSFGAIVTKGLSNAVKPL